MKQKRKNNRILVSALSIFFLPMIVFAHQPRLALSSKIIVTDPEISKAYYAQLSGQPESYFITSDKAFQLYVNVLVPDIAGQKKDVSATIYKQGNPAQFIASLDGNGSDWKPFYEPFGNDQYWQGPEFRQRVDPGTYEIRVSSNRNDSKYALAIGETENFDLNETLNAIHLIPQIKQDFFNESPISFAFSIFGAAYLIFIFLISFAIGALYRAILKMVVKDHPNRVSTKSPQKWEKNINRNDRLLRFVIGMVFLFWAITTSWSWLLLFFSGFCFYEAAVSWCGVYALYGKNTCSSVDSK